VRVLRSSLEDAYLEAVSGAPTGDGAAPYIPEVRA
jgi:hypothetical protein